MVSRTWKYYFAEICWFYSVLLLFCGLVCDVMEESVDIVPFNVQRSGTSTIRDIRAEINVQRSGTSTIRDGSVGPFNAHRSGTIKPGFEHQGYPEYTSAPRTSYSRSDLYAMRRQPLNKECVPVLRSLNLLRMRGRRGGKSVRSRFARVSMLRCNMLRAYTSNSVYNSELHTGNNTCSCNIQTVIGHRPIRYIECSRQDRNNLIEIPCRNESCSYRGNENKIMDLPTFYVFNSRSLAKPHALEQLEAELLGYSIDAAIISETHFKNKHTDDIIKISGYHSIRRDRRKRKAGGVAIFLRDS